jgi:MoxR-like ATPase
MTLFATPQTAPTAPTAPTASGANRILSNFLKIYEVAEQHEQSRILNKIICSVLNVDFSVRGIKEDTGMNWYSFRESTQFAQYFDARLTDATYKTIVSQFRAKAKDETNDALNKAFTMLSATEPTAATEPIQNTNRIQTLNRNPMNTTSNNTPTAAIAADRNTMQAAMTFQLPIFDYVDQGIKQYVNPILDNLMNEYNIKFDLAVQAEAAKQSPTVFHINGATQGNTVKGKTHILFNKIVKKLAVRNQVYLKGPSGSGKSFMGEQLAQALNVPFYQMQITAGITENHFCGRMLADGSYAGTPFQKAFENGGLILMDEVDKGDSNSLTAVNNALSNGILNLPNRTQKTDAARHPQFYIVATGNTWGSGNDENFAGSEIQDEAFLKRFEGAFFEVGYDTALETELLAEAPELLNKMNRLRANLEENKLQRTMSTRDYNYALKDLKAGFEIDEIIIDFTNRFSDFEKTKALRGITQ